MKVKNSVNFDVDKPCEVSIRRVDNGFILTKLEEMYSDSDEPVYRNVQIIFEDGAGIGEIDGIEDMKFAEDMDKKVSMHSLIHSLMEEFDVQYSKHHPANLVVKLEVRDGI